MRDSAIIRIPKEQIFEIVRHFLFGLPMETNNPDLLISTWFVPGTNKLLGIEINNKDLYKARQWVLELARDFKQLSKFKELWEAHLKELESWRNNGERTKGLD